MNQSAERGGKKGPSQAGCGVAPDDLPYVVEMWNEAGDRVQRVIARACNLSLGRAIFKAGAAENPRRQLTLRRNGRIIASSKDAVRADQ
jgi:hypothetical protein